MNLSKIWKNRKNIFWGIFNYLFNRYEYIANQRMSICISCENYDISGSGCEVKGTAPCCNNQKGGCGCSLKFLTHSLEDECIKGKWKAVK